jgi:hypothetical protein
MTSLTELRSQNSHLLPHKLSKAIVEAINSSGPTSKPMLAFDSLIKLGETSLSLLREIALSEYLHVFVNDHTKYGLVWEEVQACANAPGAGTDLNLIRACWKELQGGDSILAQVRLDDKGDVPEVQLFCEAWSHIIRTATDAPSPLAEFHVPLIIAGKPKHSLNGFLAHLVNSRNAYAHHGHFKTTRGAVVKLDLNENFYHAVVPILESAMAGCLRHLASVLSRYLPCEVLENHAHTSKENLVKVRSTRPDDVDHLVVVPNSTNIRRKTQWFVDLADSHERFCFAVVRPEDVGAPESDSPSLVPSTPKWSEGASFSVRDASPDPSTVQEAVSLGLFTPVLGAGCYRVQSNLAHGRAHVEDRKNRLRELCDSVTEQRYVDSVVASKLRDDGLPIRLGTAVAEPRQFESHELLLLQIALVRFAVGLTRSFAAAMGERIMAITELDDVTVQLDSVAWDPLEKSLNEAVKAAVVLSDAPLVKGQDIPLGLGAFGIEKRLKALKAALTVQTPTVSLTLLEWIGDLIWHTLRFRAPMYPAPDDLAFQISMCLADSPVHRKHTMGATASPFDEKRTIASCLEMWLPTWAHREGHARSLFHEALARALLHAMGSGTPSTGNRSTASVLVSNRRFVPIALDTTFEEELERVFRDRGIPYSVAFPVEMCYFVKEEDGAVGSPKSQECWILYTRRGSDQSKWTYLGSEKHPDSKGVGSKPLARLVADGPLIVKLNGAPLIRLPDDDELADVLEELPEHLGVSSIQHRVIVSYSEMMRAIAGQEALPPGLLSELMKTKPRDLMKTKPSSRSDPPPRTLCLLGFPLTDSNSRLRIYDLYRGKATSTVGANSRFDILFVDTPKDPVQHAFLRVGRNLIDASLEEIGRMIDHTTGLPELPTKVFAGVMP